MSSRALTLPAVAVKSKIGCFTSMSLPCSRLLWFETDSFSRPRNLMTVRLCQACCQWVWTKNERCPGCDDAVAVARASMARWNPAAASPATKNSFPRTSSTRACCLWSDSQRLAAACTHKSSDLSEGCEEAERSTTSRTDVIAGAWRSVTIKVC